MLLIHKKNNILHTNQSPKRKQQQVLCIKIQIISNSSIL